MNKYNEPQKADHTDKADTKIKAEANMKQDGHAKTDVTANKTSMDAKTDKATQPVAGQKKWPQQVKAAKTQWGKLSEAEILGSDGNPSQLSGLVQKHYHIASDAADKQVKTFLDSCRHTA
ncbi:hypothetical protein [Rheinheimera metallidurans]|uniref:hypothetical protein n=1 Tax=Rheinheimera metallidurans TaxID=2925781 RepID=UPI00300151AD